MDDEDIDIYEDLPSFEVKDSVASKELTEKCLKYEEEIIVLKTKLECSEKSRNTMAQNLSSLMKTARGEITRKDKMIAQLRQEIDNLTFRRGNHGVKKKSFVNREVRKESDKNTEKEKTNVRQIKMETTTAQISQWSDLSEEENEDFGEIYQQDNISKTLFGERLRKRIMLEEEEERAQKRNNATTLSEKLAKIQENEEKMKKDANGLIKKENSSPLPFNGITIKEEIINVSSIKEEINISTIKKEIDNSSSNILSTESSKPHRNDEKNLYHRGDLEAKLFKKKHENLINLAHGITKPEDDRFRREDSRRREQSHYNDYNYEMVENYEHSRNTSKYTDRHYKESNRYRDDNLRMRQFHEIRSESIHRSHSTDRRYNEKYNDRNYFDKSNDYREKYEKRREDRRYKEDDNWYKCKKETMTDLREKIEYKSRDRYDYDNYNDQIMDENHQRRSSKSRSEKSRSRSSGRSREKELEKKPKNRSEKSKSIERLINVNNTIIEEPQKQSRDFKDLKNVELKSQDNKSAADESLSESVRNDEKYEKIEKIEKTKKNDEIEKVDKIKKNEKIDKVAKIEKTEKVDKIGKTEKVDKIKETEKIEKTEKVDKIEKTKKVDKIEETEKIEKIEETEKIEKIAKIEKTEKVDKIEKTEKVEKIEKTEKVDKIEETEKIEKKKNEKISCEILENTTTQNKTEENEAENRETASNVTVEKIINEIEIPAEIPITVSEKDSNETLITSTVPEVETELASRSCREEEIENIEKFIKDYRENENPWLPIENEESTERDKSSNSTASIVDALSMDIEELPLDKKSNNLVTDNQPETSTLNTKDVTDEAKISVPPQTSIEEQNTKDTPETSETSETQSSTEKNSVDKLIGKQMKRRPRIPCIPIISRYSRKKPSILTDSGASNCIVQSKSSKKNISIDVKTIIENIETRENSTEKLTAQSIENNKNKTDSHTEIDKLVENSNNFINNNSAVSVSSEIQKNPIDDSRVREDDKKCKIDEKDDSLSTEVEMEEKSKIVQIEVRENRTNLKSLSTPISNNNDKLTNRKRTLPKDDDTETKLDTSKCKILVTVRRRRRIHLEDSCTAMTLVPSAHSDKNWNEFSNGICLKSEKAELSKLVSEPSVKRQKCSSIEK